MLVFTLSSADLNSQTRVSPRNPEDSRKRNPGWLISLLPLLSKDAARVWMCVASSTAAASRGRAGSL